MFNRYKSKFDTIIILDRLILDFSLTGRTINAYHTRSKCYDRINTLLLPLDSCQFIDL